MLNLRDGGRGWRWVSERAGSGRGWEEPSVGGADGGRGWQWEGHVRNHSSFLSTWLSICDGLASLSL